MLETTPSNEATLSTPDASFAEVSADTEASAEVRSPARRTALALGAAICGAALLWRARPARAALYYNDVQTLRFLEEVEELQVDFFTRVARSKHIGELSERERAVLFTVAQQDREHAGWFTRARERYGISEYSGFYLPNASRSRPPRLFRFPVELFSSRERLLTEAAAIKEISAGAYYGLVPRVRDRRLMQAIAALAGVEGRHAAALQAVSDTAYRPDAMETALRPAQVMDRLREFGFRGEPMQ